MPKAPLSRPICVRTDSPSIETLQQHETENAGRAGRPDHSFASDSERTYHAVFFVPSQPFLAATFSRILALRARRRWRRSRSAATSSSPPKTISARSNSSRTASRPASTTRWSRSCANRRRSRSARKSCPGPEFWPASAPASTTSRSPRRSSPRSASSRSTSPARSPTRRTITSSARATRASKRSRT